MLFMELQKVLSFWAAMLVYVRDFHNYGKRFPLLILKICLKKHNSSNLEFQGFDSFFFVNFTVKVYCLQIATFWTA